MADWDKILKSLAIMEADYPNYGSVVMTRLFTQHPYTQKMWPKMADIAKADLRNDAHVTNVGAQVVQKWAEMIKAKGSHMNILRSVAHIHAAKYGIPINYMKLMPATIREVLGDMAGLDGSGKLALKKMMDVIITDMNMNYQELGYVHLSC